MMDRKKHWEQIYANKSPLEVSWYQKEPALSLRMIQATGIGKSEPLIDVGGGASLLVDRLLAIGYSRLAVLDISAEALASTRERVGEHAHKVEWYETDITEFTPSHSFSLWHDRAVFHFLTQESDRKRYVEAVQKTLVSGGHLILAAFAIGGPTMCSGLDIVQYDAEKLLQELGNGFQLIEQVDETHITPTGYEQLFSYFRLARTGT